jgi:hypothetical protein
LQGESLAAIRSIRVGFQRVRSRWQAVNRNIFAQGRQRASRTIAPRPTMRSRMLRCMAFRLSRNRATSRKGRFHRHFCALLTNAQTAWCNPVGSELAAFAVTSRRRGVVARPARLRAIKQKCWFFCRGVVIRMQCSRSPRALHDIATHSRLGGQHGEEAKDEDQVSGEERRAQDEGAPEEVRGTRRFQSST